MRMKLAAALAAVAMVVLAWAGPARAMDGVWRAEGRAIQLNGKAFTVKGVNYSPAPIGSDTAWTPFGDYFVSTWRSVWQRDLAQLRAMGANSVRLYFMYPYLKKSDYSNGPVADHDEFLAAAYNGGSDPVYVFVAYPLTNVVYQYKVVSSIPTDGSWYYQDPTSGNIYVVDEAYDKATAAPRRATQMAEYVRLASQLADNPAVMGFVISNEANNGIARHHPAFWQYLDDVAGQVKNTAPDRLTMIALVDDSMESVIQAEKLGNKMPNIDVWGINSYRGNVSSGFDNLFSSFASASSKPLLVTEYGCPASGRSGGSITELADNAQAQADYLEAHWRDIVAHSGICPGGYVFEWNDEWWKNGNAAKHDPGVATNSAFPGGWDDEEWFGVNSVAVNNRPANDPWNPGQPNQPDKLGPRAAVDTLQSLWK